MAAARTKKALVTGGAGGIGQAIVRKLCHCGFDVFALDLDQTKAASLINEISADSNYTGKAHFVQCDLSDLSGTQQTLEKLIERESVINVLVNNAAIYPSKSLMEFSREEYQKVQTVNVEAAVVCANVLLPGMIKSQWGRVVNISSITAFGKFPNLMPYVVSKGALISLTRALATEMGEHGITVNTICPGAIPTDAEKIQGDLDEYGKVIMAQQALKRRGSIDDIANVVHFFASEESGFVTGQTLNVDGGWVMH